MNLLSGLERVWTEISRDMDIFEEDRARRQKCKHRSSGEKPDIPTEDNLWKKRHRCPVCDKVFKTKMIKNGRVKRLRV